MFLQTVQKKIHPAVQFSTLLVVETRTLLGVTGRFSQYRLVAGKGGKGSELRCPGLQTHPGMVFRLRMGQVDNVIVCVGHALCPPICLLRSTAVAPSSKFRPRRMAFFPYFCLMVNKVSWMRRSLASCADCSACRASSTL